MDLDLDLVETKDLVSALARRSHCCVVILTQSLDAVKENEEWWAFGPETYCMGLAQGVASRLSAATSSRYLGFLAGDDDDEDAIQV